MVNVYVNVLVQYVDLFLAITGQILVLWTETIPYLPMLEEKLKIKKNKKRIKSKKQI